MTPTGPDARAHRRFRGRRLLTRADQQQKPAGSVEALTRQALGWALPLALLQYWVRGALPRGRCRTADERDSAPRASPRTAGESRSPITRMASSPDGAPARPERRRQRDPVRHRHLAGQAPDVGAQRFPAPAKLNLMLRVVGRRADGYHLLQTVFRFIDYGDEFAITVREDGAICAAPCPRTSRRRRSHAARGAPAAGANGRRGGRRHRAREALPLGGGSGRRQLRCRDGAARAQPLWDTRLARAELQALALELGADVPVFVFGERASARGSAKCSRRSRCRRHGTRADPAVEVATARIFSHPELKRDSKPIKIQGFSVPQRAANDLEASFAACIRKSRVISNG